MHACNAGPTACSALSDQRRHSCTQHRRHSCQGRPAHHPSASGQSLKIGQSSQSAGRGDAAPHLRTRMLRVRVRGQRRSRQLAGPNNRYRIRPKRAMGPRAAARVAISECSSSRTNRRHLWHLSPARPRGCPAQTLECQQAARSPTAARSPSARGFPLTVSHSPAAGSLMLRHRRPPIQTSS
jgi:hypothetical protein